MGVDVELEGTSRAGLEGKEDGEGREGNVTAGREVKGVKGREGPIFSKPWINGGEEAAAGRGLQQERKRQNWRTRHRGRRRRP